MQYFIFILRMCNSYSNPEACLKQTNSYLAMNVSDSLAMNKSLCSSRNTTTTRLEKAMY